MTSEPQHVLTLELPHAAANELLPLLTADGVQPALFASRRLSGQEIATIVIPISIGAVQVAATFLSAWLQKRGDRPAARDADASIRVLVDGTAIEATHLTPDHVERILGKALDSAAHRPVPASPPRRE